MKKILLGAFALSLISGFNAAKAQGPTDYLASYPLGTDANDQSSNGYNGTISGDVVATADRHGNAQGAYYFDGSGDYITLSNAASFEVQEYTYSAWIKPTDMLTSYSILAFGGSGGDQVLGYGVAGAYLSSYTQNASNAISVNSDSMNLDTTWHHLLGIRKANSIEIYVDGKLIKSGVPDFTTTAYGNSSWATIGRSHRSTGYFKGSIDDVKVYDRALSSTEIAELCPTTKCEYKNYHLIAKYLFNNDATDSDTNKLDLATSGDPQFVNDRFGNAQSALEFDGSGDYLSTTSSLFHLNKYSYSLWMKHSDVKGVMLAVGNSGGDQAVSYTGSAINGGSYTVNASDISNINSGVLVVDTGWHHVVVIRDSLKHSMYVDGQLVADTTTNYSTVAYGSSDLFLIGKSHRNNDHFTGSIDDVLIYDVALTNEEIQNLYSMNCTDSNAVSVATIEEKESGIYPNPATSSVTVLGAWDSYSLFNIAGVQVKAGRLTSKVINTSNLISGMYVLQLVEGNNMKVEKLIIK